MTSGQNVNNFISKVTSTECYLKSDSVQNIANLPQRFSSVTALKSHRRIWRTRSQYENLLPRETQVSYRLHCL